MYSLISSKNNDKLKTVKKLADKKYRNEYGLFTVEGHKLVYEFNRSGGEVAQIFVTEDACEKYEHILAQVSCDEMYTVPRSLYEYISNEQSPQGIMAVCKIPKKKCGIADGPALILESVRDAGNLGTIVRTAVALGIKTLVFSSDCADLYNPKTLRAAMGALFYANIIFTEDVVSFVEFLVANGRNVYASMLSEDALEISKVSFYHNDCIVVGNEGNGISEKLAGVCTGKVIIPMQPCSESLNASVAAAILMWELTKDGTV